ncbi:MAG: C40 family peptidase [Termitinemataceae bacterium]|nr:MAG: C40 family peptidase [Termitinemataceae bacterium]
MTQIAGAQSLQSDRQMLINYAKKFLGTPYKASGSTVHGMDCSGFLFTVVRDSLKIPFPRTAEAMYKNCEIIKEGLLEPGDLVFFRPGSKINHVGIYIGEGNFIHSASDGPKTGVIISNLSDSYWNRTYAGAGRILPSIINGQ